MSDSERFDLAHTVRTEDGTILPAATEVRTGEQLLIAGLPQLVKDDSTRDLVLGETIGQGGMGLVRVADQSALGRRVAVKTLRPEHHEPALSLYLVREAWITGALEHPNIVPVYALGVDEAGRPMIVMKRIEGTPWAACLTDAERDLKWHLRILAQVCHAVEFAAARGLLHRDLKPDNVMIGPFGEVYVLDWGIAVSLSEDRGGRLPLAKDVRGISGTPAYMAPEMVTERGDGLSVRTDVYLLGAVLHELITKKKRHQGETVQQVLWSALHSRPYDFGPDIPAELAEICNRAAHLEPEQRYESAGAFRQALELFLERDGSRQLVDQAERRLEAWSALDLAGPADPVRVAALYHETRFAFQQALLEWPENPAAVSGLVACLSRKLEHDLAVDDLESASAVLRELGEGRPDLAGKVAELRARVERRRAELEALRRLEAGRNLEVGRRTRAFLMLLGAFGAGGVPILAHFGIRAGYSIGYNYYLGASALKGLAAFGLAYWARESLGRTEVNRQLTQALFLLLAVELAARPFAERLGHPVEHSLFIDFAAYFLVTATLAITVERRLLLGSALYVVGAVWAVMRPELVHLMLGLSHFGVSLFAAAIWRPRHLRGLDPRPPAL